MTVPWDFSADPAEGEATVPNEPTDEGRSLGAELARICDVEEERLRERHPNARPRCDDCALRAGTDPNGCVLTLMDVVKAAAESVPFYCHKAFDESGDPKRLCAGWAILVQSEVTPA